MSKIPEIRFSGFTDAWEQREFLDFVQRESAVQVSSFDYPSVEYEDVIAEEGRLNKNIRMKEVQKTGIKFDRTQVLYGKLRPYLHNWLNPDFMGVAVGDWWVLRPIEMDKNFLYRLIQTKKFDEVANQSSGSKMPRADWNLVSNTEFIIPTSTKEQSRIADTFDAFDSLIALHQRKYEKLKLFKAAMLEKMFPKNGETVPQIRFAGFSGEWKKRKLGECFAERSERSADGELIAITINSGVVKASELNRHDNSSEDKSNYKVVRVNDIAYNSMRMWQGASGYSRYDGILSPAYTVLIPQEGINSRFFAYMFKRYDMIHEFEINSQGLTKDTWNLKYPALSPIRIMMPKHEEQAKIASYFENLDSLIVTQQRKYEKLKLFKVAMLEKMFPKGE